MHLNVLLWVCVRQSIDTKNIKYMQSIVEIELTRFLNVLWLAKDVLLSYYNSYFKIFIFLPIDRWGFCYITTNWLPYVGLWVYRSWQYRNWCIYILVWKKLNIVYMFLWLIWSESIPRLNLDVIHPRNQTFIGKTNSQ